jgi:choline dehydrogenase-like flavoprotein
MNTDRYDAIVIGSGAGGSAAAYRLVQGGLRVALLEKGDHLPTDGSTLDIQRVVHGGEFLSREPWLDALGNPLRPEEHFNVGGKTKWYGAALLRFGAHEFEADAAHACPAWPIARSDLEPYYDQVEKLLDVRRFECEPDLANILKKAGGADSGWDATQLPLSLAAAITSHRHEARHFDGFASVAGLKGEAERSLLSRLEGNPDFSLLRNAEVTSLLGSSELRTRIDGVRLASGTELRAPRIFLAAGALHSPRLLARYLKTNALDSTLPAAQNVGRNLKLHLLTAMVSLSTRRMTDSIRKTMVLTNELYPHSSVQPLGFDGELMGTLIPKLVPQFLRRQIGDRAYGFFLQTEDGSHGENRVYERTQVDGVDRVMDYDEWRTADAAREHRAFTRAFQRNLLRAGLVSFTRRIGLNGTAHVCGTLACGTDPAKSVVDSHGRVHGLRGLYVVDGSVLPRSSRVNPSLTIYAWALRAADLVARQFVHESRDSRLHTMEAAHV